MDFLEYHLLYRNPSCNILFVLVISNSKKTVKADFH